VEKRRLGKTGLDVSLLGFGCGAVGGLMVGGAPTDQERAVARALELGINYFDTAAQYGNGRSEENLGRVLKALKPDIYVGTKVRLPPTTETGQIGAGITAALEASLSRLQLERVDLYQFHNAIIGATGGGNFAAESMLDEVVPAFEKLVQQGKIGHYGITAVGDTASLLRVVDARAFATAQVSFNL
jgi:aryl-alcohol dehydrogenase-like predicted oxidoreductase